MARTDIFEGERHYHSKSSLQLKLNTQQSEKEDHVIIFFGKELWMQIHTGVAWLVFKY